MKTITITHQDDLDAIAAQVNGRSFSIDGYDYKRGAWQSYIVAAIERRLDRSRTGSVVLRIY